MPVRSGPRLLCSMQSHYEEQCRCQQWHELRCCRTSEKWSSLAIVGTLQSLFPTSKNDAPCPAQPHCWHSPAEVSRGRLECRCIMQTSPPSSKKSPISSR